MQNFKETFEMLGYTFQSLDVLEDVYLFYKYYSNKANKGVSSILLEGDPGSGKTYLSEIFSKFLGKDTEYIYTQCVEETNSDRLIATYNVPAIVKGDADKSIAEGILTRAINLANSGKKVVLTIDELDKAREALDSYFLDFLQNGRIENSDNEILSLTDDGRKNLYVILAKNDERDLKEALLRRCSVIKLPPMPPVLAYKTLVKTFENTEHDSKFLRFISKVYEAIYNEQMDSDEELLSRLPALQELISAITSDNELYKNGISSTRRIKNLIRKLGKDEESRKIITDILVNKFRYENQESNYNETLDLNMNNPDDYMSNSDSGSLISQYIDKKDSGDYVFDNEDDEDPMKEVASVLDGMREDKALIFLAEENKEKIVELGTIIHHDPQALKILFDKIRFRGNPNSRFGFLSFEDENFVGLVEYKDTLVLIANKEYVSPRLLMNGLSVIISIIYDYQQNVMNNFYFSPTTASNFKMTGFNAKILSNIPNFVLNKMSNSNGSYIYQQPNLKITYDDGIECKYFKYLQKYQAEPLYKFIERICMFNPELAIPCSFIHAKDFDFNYPNERLIDEYSELDKEDEWLKQCGWEITKDEFDVMDLNITKIVKNDYYNDEKIVFQNGEYVFKIQEDKDYENKTIYMYPKYKLNGKFLIYNKDKDFDDDKNIKMLDSFQKEIALLARSIFGNYVSIDLEEKHKYFSSLTMSQTGRIVENEQNRIRIPKTEYDISNEKDFKDYYDSLSEAQSVIASEKVLKRTLK